MSDAVQDTVYRYIYNNNYLLLKGGYDLYTGYLGQMLPIRPIDRDRPFAFGIRVEYKI